MVTKSDAIAAAILGQAEPGMPATTGRACGGAPKKCGRSAAGWFAT